MLTPLTSAKDFAQYLGVKYSKLMFVIYGKSLAYEYSQFSIPKSTGGYRIICAPKPMLKALQRRLAIYLERIFEPHDAATAFIKGRGIVANAEKHVKRKLVFNLDLSDFYGAIHFGRIKGLLCAKPYSLDEDVARIIAHICCLNGKLPQGAPTSPIIANMICYKLDRELSYLAKKNKATYTRYADDITYSFRNSNISEDICSLDNESLIGDRLRATIESNGFEINPGKTRVSTKLQSQVVTGLKVNQKVNVDRRYIRTTRSMIHSLAVDIKIAEDRYKQLSQGAAATLEAHVLGRINYIGMVKGRDSSVYETLATRFNDLPIESQAPVGPISERDWIEKSLHFYKPSQREKLEKSVWLVEFDSLDGVADEFTVGSAFAVGERRLLTCFHVFEKAGSEEYCYLSRAKAFEKRIKAKIVYVDKQADIAVLEPILPEGEKIPFLKIAPEPEKHAGYKVAFVGFPGGATPGTQSVAITSCTISNSFIASTIRHYNVDKVVQGGCSGGPVINAYMQVLGIVRLGYSVGEGILDGNNAFVSAANFPKY